MRHLLSAVVLIATTFCSAFASADESLPTPPQSSAAESFRSGGRVAESYEYHLRQVGVPLQPMHSAIEHGGIPQANGWYNYGFPMRSYRYGWFGAERQPPRVYWHRGYYGDKTRVEYQNYY
jgi:hypothetical protein